MARKTNNNPKCPYCDSESIKYGKRYEIQRYRCKNKHKQHVFYDPSFTKQTYQRNSKRILSLLLNMLDNDFFNENDLEKALNPNDKYYKYARETKFDTRYNKNVNIPQFDINCYNPKLLICQDDKNITFIKIPPFDHEKLEISEPENNSRTIKIIDNRAYGNMSTIGNKNIVPYVKYE